VKGDSDKAQNITKTGEKREVEREESCRARKAIIN
jgi:hypothetical protein